MQDTRLLCRRVLLENTLQLSKKLVEQNVLFQQQVRTVALLSNHLFNSVPRYSLGWVLNFSYSWVATSSRSWWASTATACRAGRWSSSRAGTSTWQAGSSDTV